MPGTQRNLVLALFERLKIRFQEIIPVITLNF